ncbi:hypothetical protein [Burkholderia sp. NLJ2]|uniref:hypothetical protein n=1 Tax=Burkholderia sp. NLJ2 TaxID=3090699 RepID=UPI003C6C0409
MTFDAANASYDTLARDTINGNLPEPQKICTDCTVPGPIFSVNPDGGARNADLLLGIPSQGKAATYRWFMDNPWIRDKERNYRDTFLIRVLDRFGAQHGDAKLAELYAFLAVQGCEIICLDDDIADDTLSPAVLDEFGKRTNDGMGFSMRRNFVFAAGKLYYLTFTSVTWKDVRRREYVDEDGFNGITMPFTWNRPTGLFADDLAVQQLTAEFERAKARVRIWEAIKGLFEVATALLAFVPVAGEVALGARGAVGGVRYVFVAIDRALAMDALADGTSRMITGEGLSIGEKFFESLAALSDPKTAEDRGKQVFMGINLAMLTPSVFGAARWAMRQVGGKAVKLDVKMLNEEELKRLAQHKNGQAMAVETVVETRDRMPGGSRVQVKERHSLDTNKSHVVVSAESGRADFAVVTNNLRERVALQIQLIATARKGKRLGNVVGNVGEEIFAASMVTHWRVKPENILGYNPKPGAISRLGLKNKSDHGLDVLLKVPPPPEMQIRVPAADSRHHIEGLRGVSESRTLTFKEETLIVVELKTTLGKKKTPGFYENTQGKGGEYNTRRVVKLAQRGGPYWKREQILELDPSAMDKVDTIQKAQRSGNIQYIHAQVFLDSEGKINTVVGNGVGRGSGVQLNDWPGT